MKTVILLTISNIFMTIAWYGHLKYRNAPLFIVVLISWGIAFFEYCFQVPANRIGSYQFTTAQLKTIQEVITLGCVFRFFCCVSERTAEVELPGWVCHDRRRRRGHFQEMVKQATRSLDESELVRPVSESRITPAPRTPASRWTP